MSFRHAFRGLRTLVRTQRNARVHAVATVAVAAAGWWLGVSRMEWCVLALACAGVWASEALNTAIEFLADAVTLEQHPLIGRAKDVAAGAVLIMALAAVIVGCAVFAPYVLKTNPIDKNDTTHHASQSGKPIDNMNNNEQVAKILIKLNAWNKGELESFEIMHSGTIPDVIPSGETNGYVMQCKKELHDLGYEAVWDGKKLSYTAKPMEQK